MDVCFFVIPAQAGIRRFGIVFKRSGSDFCRCGNDALIYLLRALYSGLTKTSTALSRLSSKRTIL
ncbi:hypothetical protein A6J47_001850 [Neisseria meningitidis]|nr:hypothetical protein A6J47_001850 [Neisseria meningitidis]